MEIKKNISSLWYKIIVGACIVGSLGAASYYFYYVQNSDAILDFNELRDTQFILDSFKRDWHWLVEGFDYSPEYMLQNRASSKKAEHKGNLTIKVGYHDKTPVGFVIYFMKNFYLGDVRFIDVAPEFRSKGWSDKLLDYAMNDLLKRGSSKIELVTRTTNLPAQKLYTRHGFKEASREDGFVYYEYMPSL